MSEKLAAIKAYQPDTGDYQIRADANESFIDLPIEMKQTLAIRLSKIELNRYPDPYAIELRRSAAEYYGVNLQNIAPGNGSDELIGVILGSFLKKGARLCVAAPDFSMYNFYAHMAELEVVTTEKTDLTIDTAELIKAAKSADMLIFSNPCNPTGQALAPEEVLEIAQSLPCPVVVDEAYMEFYGQSVIPYIGQHKNLVVLRTCSKAVGLAAARVGFAISNPETTADIMKAKSPYNISSLDQTVAQAVLLETEYIQRCVKSILDSKKHLLGLLKPLGFEIIDTQTNFLLLRAQNAAQLHKHLAKNGVCVRLIMGDCLRITAAKPQDNIRIASLLSQLK